MSTEPAQSPEMAKRSRKPKRSKGSTDNKTKKRKREEEEQQQEEEPEVVPDSHYTGPSKKKQKKVKLDTPPHDQDGSSTKQLELQSPFIRQTSSLYLPLSPCAYDFPLEGLCAEHISPLLLTYYPPLNGVLLSYAKPRMSEQPCGGIQVTSSSKAKSVLSQSINEYAVSYIWLTAEFVLFKPQRGRWLEGYVSLQNESLLGLVCYNYFNAVIEQDRLPEQWRWEGGDEQESLQPQKGKKRTRAVQGSGYWVDGDGKKVEGRICFRVEDFEASASMDGTGSVTILGTLREDGEVT